MPELEYYLPLSYCEICAKVHTVNLIALNMSYVLVVFTEIPQSPITFLRFQSYGIVQCVCSEWPYVTQGLFWLRLCCQLHWPTCFNVTCITNKNDLNVHYSFVYSTVITLYSFLDTTWYQIILWHFLKVDLKLSWDLNS